MSKNKTKKGGKIIAILSIITCFGLCVALADLFSTFITVGTFSNNTITKNSGFSVYAVSLYETSVKSTANEQSTKLQKSNGAGYIWQENETYYVLASAYIEENDAQKVLENLKNSGYNTSIIKIKIPQLKINSGYNNDEITVLTSATSLFKTTYDALYDISVSLDTEVTTETQCRLNIANLQSEVSKVKADFETLFNSKLTTSLLKLKLSINSVSTLIQQLIDFNENNNQTLSSKIKYNYIEVLYLQKTLGNSIQKI